MVDTVGLWNYQPCHSSHPSSLASIVVSADCNIYKPTSLSDLWQTVFGIERSEEFTDVCRTADWCWHEQFSHSLVALWTHFLFRVLANYIMYMIWSFGLLKVHNLFRLYAILFITVFLSYISSHIIWNASSLCLFIVYEVIDRYTLVFYISFELWYYYLNTSLIFHSHRLFWKSVC